MTGKKAFDSFFEEKICQAVILDPHWGEQISEVVSLEYFDLIHTRKIAEILFGHFDNYRTFPSMSLIESICEREIEDEPLSKKCLDYLRKMKQNPLNGDEDYVKEKALEFFRRQNIAIALESEILPKLENGQNLEDIVQIFQSAVTKGTNRNIGYDYNEDEEVRFEKRDAKKIPTIWPYLNNILDGGFEVKRLTTWIGSAGAGKSSLLAACGAGMLLAGKTVIHYSLELDEIDVAKKYDAVFTKININDICGYKDQVLHSLKAKLPPEARLIIKEYPMKSASIQTIRSHINRLKLKGIFPDAVIIDYGDLLRNVEASNPREERRHGLESIWQDMKALAQSLEIVVITATQTNRSGYQSDIITPDQVSEDFSKIMTSDIVITLARNMEQKASGIGKMYVAKNRQGRDGQIFAYSLNPANVQIEMFELTEDIEKRMVGEPEDSVDEVQDKLKQFLSKGRRGVR
jgi:replicative DNA helicase